jgi:hypothetical protein
MRRRIIAFLFGVLLAATVSLFETARGQEDLILEGTGGCVGRGCQLFEYCTDENCWLASCYVEGNKLYQCNYECPNPNHVCVVAN